MLQYAGLASGTRLIYHLLTSKLPWTRVIPFKLLTLVCSVCFGKDSFPIDHKSVKDAYKLRTLDPMPPERNSRSRRPSDFPLMYAILTANSKKASHSLWFKPCEPTSSRTVLSAVLLVTAPIIWLLQLHLRNILLAVVLAEGTYVLALLTSIAAYRLSPWHPLSSVPGPLIGKVSKVWMAYIAWTGKGHEYYALLHERYGTVVRIGESSSRWPQQP